MTAQATHTGGGAPARIYRWESVDAGWGNDTGRVLRTDDDRPLTQAAVAEYVCPREGGDWLWMTWRSMRYARVPTEDAARRACLLAVLHADAEEPGESEHA